MEKLTAEQALTFVAATSKGAPKIVLDSWLGNGMTPTVGDFNSDDRIRHDCANRYLECLTLVRDSLVEHLRCLPIQKDIFDGHPPTTTISNTIAITDRKISIAKPETKTKEKKKKPAAKKKKPTQKKKTSKK